LPDPAETGPGFLTLALSARVRYLPNYGNVPTWAPRFWESCRHWPRRGVCCHCSRPRQRFPAVI